MFEELRLTELHEEWAWQEFRGKSLLPYQGRLEAAFTAQERAKELDSEIRRRVARRRPPWTHPLRYGISDAARVYPRRRDLWTNHARHDKPVASCHLCREHDPLAGSEYLERHPEMLEGLP